MPKVRQLGASMLRGNATNFYIRCDDDLDDQDTDVRRDVAVEYPHIHVATTGPHQHDDITYIGITYGGAQQNIDIYVNGGYVLSVTDTVAEISARCTRISRERVHPLTQYLHGYTPQVAYQ